MEDVFKTYMILLVVTALFFVGLLAAAVLKIKQRIMVLGACVILLVVCNLINEFAAANTPPLHQSHQPQKDKQHRVQEIAPWSIGVLINETAEEKMGDLLEEERDMASYLYKRWEANEYPLVRFDSLHRNRLRIVLELVNHRINNTNPERNILPFRLDYKQQECDGRCLRKTVRKAASNAYIVFIVENTKNAGQLSDLQQLCSNQKVAIIFEDIPKFFPLHTISRLTYRFPFSNNYLSKILEQHPSKTIEHCSLYRSFDYHFYSASLTTPLMELCSRTLPSTPAVRCVKKYMTEEKTRVPQGWVRECLKEEGQEGLVIQDGWVGVRKEYFWSGKVNKTDLLPTPDEL